MNNNQLEANKEICLGLSKAIMDGNWELANELLAENFQYIGDGNPPMNKQQYLGFMRGVLCTAMTEMDMKFLRVIAESNLVAVDYTNEMTNSGPFFEIPATNKRINASGQFIREIKDNKVVAEWQTTNMLGMMKQLGVVPQN